MTIETILHFIPKNGDPLLFTSKDLCEILSKFLNNLEREYQGSRFESLPGIIEKKVNQELFCHVCHAVQLIDKTIVDGRNGVCALSQGNTNEYLPKHLSEFKDKAANLSSKISKEIQLVKREIAFLISPIVNCLNKFDELDDRIFENLSSLTSNSVPTVSEVRDLLPSQETMSYEFDCNKTEGILRIDGFQKIEFKGRRAAVLYYFYRERYKEEIFDYQDVNEFIKNFQGLASLSYDCLRLDIKYFSDSIKKATENKISSPIHIEKREMKNKTIINKYRWIAK